MKILLPVDGSPYTKRMLAYVAAHEEWFGAAHRYFLLTVVAPISPRAASFLSREDCAAYYNDEAEAVLAPVRKFVAQQGWQADLMHRTGRAAETIAEVAQAQQVDVIVMGSHGHSALGNIVMGSVATGVLARCKQPVLLIR